MSGLSLLPSLVIVLATHGMVSGALAQNAGTVCPTIDDARSALAFPVSKDAAMRFRPGDPARKVLARDQAQLKQCATSEGAWYAILRARELLGCDPRRTLDMVEQAQRLVPKSVSIATLRARLLSTATAAKEALALDPRYLPAQLALASALLDEGRLGEASAVLRKIDRPEAKGLKARVRLAHREYRGALSELGQGGAYVLGGDIFLLEPNAGLRWPWNDDQVQALAQADLGKADYGARILFSDHVGTLPELRTAVAQRTKAAQRLMTAMGRLIDEARDVPESSAEMAVALARLRFVAGQIDEAVGLITVSPATRALFCATLPEFTWVLSAGGTQPVAESDRLQSVCSPDISQMKLPTEPPECMSPK
jgi:hypothetical protein